MANFPKMKLTNAGLNLLTNVQAGADVLTFTKTALGDGELSAPLASLTALVSPKVEIAITEGKKVGTTTYQIGAFFSNQDVKTGFRWREIGVFAKGNDGAEILYCYSNAGDAGDYIPVGSDERVEKYIYQSLAIGNATNVTAEINGSDTFISVNDKGAAGGVAPLNENGKVAPEHLPEMDFASTARVVKIETDLSGHLTASNPHGITAAKIGLGNVPNVATNDQTPTYTEASTLTALTSGEKLSVAFGKIKKAVADFISHLADTTKHITAAERTAWNGKAPTSHASAAATYGIGTAANYGHLKITDSKTSTATDTAASAKALAETYAIAKKADLSPIKTLSINIANITWEGATDKVYTVPISGVDWEAYEEFELVLNGTISFPAATGTATRSLGIGLSYNTNNSTTINSGFAGIAVASKSAGSAETRTIDNLRTKIHSINHLKINGARYTHYADSVTSAGSSSVAGALIRVVDSTYDGTIYLKVVAFQETSLSAAASLTLTADVYGKGAR